MKISSELPSTVGKKIEKTKHNLKFRCHVYQTSSFATNLQFLLFQNHDKWKYPVNSKVATPTNSMSNMIGVPTMTHGVYDALHAKALGTEHLVYLPGQVNMQGIPMQQFMQQNLIPQPQTQLRNQVCAFFNISLLFISSNLCPIVYTFSNF